MRMRPSTLAAASCLAASMTAFAAPKSETPRPLSPTVGYACVPTPKKGETKVVMTPPPPGFKCPPGETLFLVTKQMQDQVAAAPFTEAPGPGPLDPVFSGTPGPNQPQEVRAPKKKNKKKQCTPTYGGMYCCYGGYSDCRIE